MVSPLYWALEPESEILMFVWSVVPLLMSLRCNVCRPQLGKSKIEFTANKEP